jgi:hypothetical protein
MSVAQSDVIAYRDKHLLSKVLTKTLAYRVLIKALSRSIKPVMGLPWTRDLLTITALLCGVVSLIRRSLSYLFYRSGMRVGYGVLTDRVAKLNPAQCGFRDATETHHTLT